MERRKATGPLAGKYALWALVGGCVALLLLACGGDGGDTGELPAHVAAVFDTAGEFQQEILADGLVEPGEYEKAVLAALQCLDQAGIPHGEPVLTSKGARAPKWRFIVGPYPPGSESTAEECQTTYLNAVAAVWSAQEAPSEEELQAVRDEAVRCARERGIEATDYETMIAQIDAMPEGEADAVSECIRAAFTGELED